MPHFGQNAKPSCRLAPQLVQKRMTGSGVGSGSGDGSGVGSGSGLDAEADSNTGVEIGDVFSSMGFFAGKNSGFRL